MNTEVRRGGVVPVAARLSNGEERRGPGSEGGVMEDADARFQKFKRPGLVAVCFDGFFHGPALRHRQADLLAVFVHRVR